MDDIWFLYLILAAFPGLFVFAFVVKYVEIMQAARWPKTHGRVVVSTSESRRVRSGGPDTHDTEPRNFAKIVYEFTVAGRKYRCDRVSIGENMGNFQIAETVAKYPRGKEVTVYYNPNKPSQAVLERDLPPGIMKGAVLLVLVLAGVIVGGIVGFHKLGDLVHGIVRNPAEAPFVTACIGMALLAALMIWAIQRTVARQRTWPTARARIERSGVHEFQQRDNARGRWRTAYRAEIAYGYEIGGVRYTGAAAAGGARVSSNLESVVRRMADKYPTGVLVDIRYNPDNPAESVLGGGDRWLWLLWLLWLIPAAMLALAYFVGR